VTATPAPDSLEHHNLIYLQKQRLAASAILELAEEHTAFSILATEVHFFRDRIDQALLSPKAAAELLPWMDAPAPAATPEEDGVPVA